MHVHSWHANRHAPRPHLSISRVSVCIRIRSLTVLFFFVVAFLRAVQETEIMQHKLEEQKLRKRNYNLEKQKEKAAMNAADYLAQLQEGYRDH